MTGSGKPGDPVKIGWSGTPQDRVRSLQTGSPYKLEVLATHPGPDALEKFLHREFASQRLHGEWFLIDDPVLQIAEKVSAWTSVAKVGPRVAYAFDGSHVSVGVEQGRKLASAASGLTDKEFRVMAWYWFADRRSMFMRTQSEIAEELGVNPDALSRILKVLREARLIVKVGGVGKTTFYRCSPHLAFTGTGFAHRDAVKEYDPPNFTVRKSDC